MKRFKEKTLLIVVLLVISIISKGQQLKPEGFFLSDTIKLGEVVPFTLSFKYPKEYNVIFPDSTYDFSPFEFDRKQYFTTESDSIISFDSAVYYLSTFELDTVQKLELPVFVVEDGDSTTLFTNPDSLFLYHVVQSIPDSVALKESSFYRKIQSEFNYPYLIIGVLILAFISVIVIVFFGKDIKKRYDLYRLKKTHQRYVEKVHLLIDKAGQDIQKESEVILSEWKKYLEKLEEQPYTKLTTREIIRYHPQESLKNTLKSLDRVIYGGAREEKIVDQYRILLDYSIDSYHQKTDKIRYGK